jgi:hypothetical protein
VDCDRDSDREEIQEWLEDGASQGLDQVPVGFRGVGFGGSLFFN